MHETALEAPRFFVQVNAIHVCVPVAVALWAEFGKIVGRLTRLADD